MKEKMPNRPAKLNAPLSKTNLSRINLGLKNNMENVQNLKRKYQKCRNR